MVVDVGQGLEDLDGIEARAEEALADTLAVLTGTIATLEFPGDFVCRSRKLGPPWMAE